MEPGYDMKTTTLIQRNLSNGSRRGVPQDERKIGDDEGRKPQTV
jgi:hypothetical protein